LRARATSPAMGEAGEWREFKIDGQPGLGPDVLHPRSAAALSSASQVPAPATQPQQVQRGAPSFGTATSPTTTLDWNKTSPAAAAWQLAPRSTP
jgi:hypothetical protein